MASLTFTASPPAASQVGHPGDGSGGHTAPVEPWGARWGALDGSLVKLKRDWPEAGDDYDSVFLVDLVGDLYVAGNAVEVPGEAVD